MLKEKEEVGRTVRCISQNTKWDTEDCGREGLCVQRELDVDSGLR